MLYFKIHISKDQCPRSKNLSLWHCGRQGEPWGMHLFHIPVALKNKQYNSNQPISNSKLRSDIKNTFHTPTPCIKHPKQYNFPQKHAWKINQMTKNEEKKSDNKALCPVDIGRAGIKAKDKRRQYPFTW